MMIEQDILRRTYHGLSIYRLVLNEFYTGENPIQFSGTEIDLVKNPFNKHRRTLQLTKEEGIFSYHDIELPDFKGGPFEFAAMHYKIEGMPLFQLINHQMRLNLDVRYFRVHAVVSPNPKHNAVKVPGQPALEVSQFSFFRAPIRNVYPFKNITLVEAYKLIRSNAFAHVTQQLRSLDDPVEVRAFKASQFNYVTFSGVFSSRKDNALARHSGLITIDFDHVADVQQLKSQLLRDEHIATELLFVSPSGNGLKWIIPCNEAMSHPDFFMAVAKYIRDIYHLEIDQSGKDVSRACFLPCDPDVYINPKYLVI